MQAHTENCSSVLSRSEFDATCPRCAVINKVVMLRRKRMSLGCSFSEQQSAESLAQAMISRYELAHAECIDRLYLHREQIATRVVRARSSRKKNEHFYANMEGLTEE